MVEKKVKKKELVRYYKSEGKVGMDDSFFN